MNLAYQVFQENFRLWEYGKNGVICTYAGMYKY
jgi:hypothetical protein